MPRTTRARVPTRATSSAASRDLPTPGSPTTVVSRHSGVATTASNSRSSASSCALRPVKGVPTGRADRPEAADLDQAVRRHGLRLPLRPQRLHGVGPYCVADETERRLAEQHVARAGRLLQPRGDVHRIARDERLPTGGVTRDDLARVDADPERDPCPEASLQLLVERRQPGLHLERGPAGTQSIVLMCLGHPENGQHRVADELLHRAPVPLERAPHLVEVREHQAADGLRIDALAHRRRPGEVAEDEGRQLAPLRGGGRQRRAAMPAVEEAVRALASAARADRHRGRLRPVGPRRHGRGGSA